jgi:hypothetical protein
MSSDQVYDRTVTVGAAPDALGPDQNDRPIADRQIPDRGAPAAVADRPGPAAVATDDISGGLDLEPDLPVDFGMGADHELGHAQQRGRALTTVLHRQGPLLLLLRQVAESRGPWPRWWTPIGRRSSHHRPTLHRVEPVE